MIQPVHDLLSDWSLFGFRVPAIADDVIELFGRARNKVLTQTVRTRIDSLDGGNRPRRDAGHQLPKQGAKAIDVRSQVVWLVLEELGRYVRETPVGAILLLDFLDGSAETDVNQR